MKPKLSVLLLFLLVLNLFLVFTFSVQPAGAVFGSEDIIFEYGAEGGIVGKEPEGTYGPFDWAGASGGPVEDGYAKITEVKARTGTKSIKMYQPTPYKSGGDRRITLRKNYGNELEQYISWWAWYPDEIVNNNEWRNLGGAKIRYQPVSAPVESERARNGISVQLRSDDEIVLKVYNLYCPVRGASSGNLGEDETYTEVASGVHLNSTYRNTWVQIQLYIKISNNTDGGYKLWLDGNEIVDATGYKTDPRTRSRWTGENWEFQYSSDGTPYVSVALYNSRSEPEVWYWVDDIVFSRELVTKSYGVGGQASELEVFEDGFESGNFSAWNGTQQSGRGVAPSVTSTYAYTGTYSANFTTDGAKSSYSRAMYVVQDTTEVFLHSYVRFEDLPDTDDTRLMVLRVAEEDGTFIANVGVFRNSTGYYWILRVTGEISVYTLDAGISADTWYELGFYLKATSNGIAILWVDKVAQNANTGDFSSLGNIARVYPYIYIGDGAQSSAKTVYHDTFRVYAFIH